MEKVVQFTACKDLKLLRRGKVRDIYELPDSLLIVSTDRISAFDVILQNGIPFKGKVLNQISKFWFDFTQKIVKNHVVSVDIETFPSQCQQYSDVLMGRSMIVKKTKPIPIECIVRGYLSGSGWIDYQRTKSICGIPLPFGLKESERLPEPIFTPSTKADIGVHDENISYDKACELVGKALAEKARHYSMEVYKAAAAYAESKGVIISDTKMEFGVDESGELILIDELLTHDSSRFWDKDAYQVGKSQASFDKQFVRDYLLEIKWNKKPPAPNLPDEIIRVTSEKYLQALQMLTEKTLR